MGDEHTWRTVLDIIRSYQNPIVVVSATARTTRQLIAAGKTAQHHMQQALEISREIDERHRHLTKRFLSQTNHRDGNELKKLCLSWIDHRIQDLNGLLQKIAEEKTFSLQTKDAVASIGEHLSAYLFARCGQAYGLKTHWVDARSIIKTNSDYGQAHPDYLRIKQNVGSLAMLSQKDHIPVLGGFYGENEFGNVTTLGFEGSDYTASLIGAALDAEGIEIWTDVSGIYTCDPNVVSNARPISELSFQEATELAYFGAKVLHPSTMKPAAAASIPVFVKNIFAPGDPGTKIHEGQAGTGWAKAITYLHDIIIMTVTSDGTISGHQFLSRFFGELHENHIPVSAVTTTEAAVSVALQKDEVTEEFFRKFDEIGTVTLETGQGLISIVGCRFSYVSVISETVFSALADDTPSLISYSKAKQNFNIAVSKTALVPAVCRLHDAIFNDEVSSL